MPATPAPGPDVVDVIKAQHRVVDSLLEQATNAEPEQAQELLRRVESMLVPHSQAEEGFVYPAIAATAKEEGEEVADGTAEHHHVEGLLTQLLEADPQEPGFDGVLAALVGELRHHVEEEETELLPVLSRKLDDAARAELGARFVAETGVDLRDLDLAAASAGASGSGSDEPTRDELYEQAKQLDVAGRSSMTKDELAEAVGDAAN